MKINSLLYLILSNFAAIKTSSAKMSTARKMIDDRYNTLSVKEISILPFWLLKTAAIHNCCALSRTTNLKISLSVNLKNTVFSSSSRCKRTTKLSRPKTAQRFLGRLECLVYARHGRKLMGCKSPVYEPGQCRETSIQTLAEGKGVAVR